MDWGSIITVGLFASAVQLAVPIALAAAGETVCERAGVLNLGIEGLMLFGALGSFLGAYYASSLLVGVLCGLAAGVALAAIMGLLSIRLKTEQVINGIALVLFAQGITAFVYTELFSGGRPPSVELASPVKIPLLSEIPGIGGVFFNQNLLVYGSIVLALSTWFVVFRTRFGLSVRAAGDGPAAADAVAVNVDRVRWIALLIGGAMGGLGGAVLILGEIGLFRPEITAGRGWVAVALVVFGRWNPILVLGGAALFGLADALQLQVQAASGGTGSSVPYEVFQALPYGLTLAVLVATSIRARGSAVPLALGMPFRRTT